MNLARIRLLLIALSVLLTASYAFANINVPEEILGTDSIKFEPKYIEGNLTSCSLVFDAIILDATYKQGEPIYVAGNIGFYATQKGAVFTLKLGTKSIVDNKPVAPYLAYFKSASINTSKLKKAEFESDTIGFKNFVYPLEGDMLKIYADIIASKTVTIGFNLMKGGTDIIMPLDLTVENVASVNNTITKKYSSEMLDNFAKCTSSLVDTALSTK